MPEITTKVLVKLAQRVMGAKNVSVFTHSPGTNGFWVNVYDSYVYRGNYRWQPDLDLNQSHDALEAWLAKDTSRGYVLHRSLEPDTEYGLGFCLALRYAAYGWHQQVIASTLPKAVVLAVCAAEGIPLEKESNGV
jgi:hypothetical protein